MTNDPARVSLPAVEAEPSGIDPAPDTSHRRIVRGRLPLYGETAVLLERSQASSVGLGPSPEEVAVVVMLRSLVIGHHDALSLTAWKRVQETTWSLCVNPSSGNLHPTDGYALLPALGAIHDRPGAPRRSRPVSVDGPDGSVSGRLITRGPAEGHPT